MNKCYKDILICKGFLLLHFFLFAASSFSGSSQAGKEYLSIFAGQILEKGNRSPVSYSGIGLRFLNYHKQADTNSKSCDFLTIKGQTYLEGALVTETDSTGRFCFKCLPSCSVLVTIVYEGCKKFEKIIFIPSDTVIKVKWFLKRMEPSLYEVVVYGRKNDEGKNSVYSFTAEEATNVPASGEDAVRALQVFPSVAQPGFRADAALILRGIPEEFNGYYVDGVRVPKLFHLSCGLAFLTPSIYCSDAIGAISLYPSGYGVRYGGTTGGIVEITGREAYQKPLHSYLKAGALDASIYTEHSIVKNNVSLIGSFRRSLLSDILSYADIMINNGQIVVPMPYYLDYLARCDIKIGLKNKAFVTFMGSTDGYELFAEENAGTEIENLQFMADSSKSSFQQIITGFESSFSKNINNSFRFSLYSQKEQSAYRWRDTQSVLTGLYESVTRVKPYSIQFRDEISILCNKVITIKTGIDISMLKRYYTHTCREQEIAQSINGVIIQDDIHYKDTLTSGIVGGYLEFCIKPNDHLLFVPGLRYDYYPELDSKGSIIPEFLDYSSFNNNSRFSAEPAFRLSGNVMVNKYNTVFISAGTYNTSPVSLYYSFPKSNIHKPTIKSSHYVAGYSYSGNLPLSLTLQGYYTNWWDHAYIWYGAEATHPEPMDGRAYGIELLSYMNTGKYFRAMVSYALSAAQHRFNKKEWIYSLYDHTNTLQATGEIMARNNWLFGLRLRYISGYRYTPVEDAWYDADLHAYIGKYGKELSERLKPIFMADLRVEKKFLLKNWQMVLCFDLQNFLMGLYRSPMEIDGDLLYPRPYYLFNVKTKDEEYKTFDGFCTPFLSLKAEF
jgi:hypothetical protein